MIMKLLAITPSGPKTNSTEESFWHKVNVILLQKPYLVGLLAKPDIFRMWKHTGHTWVIHMTDPLTDQLLDEGAIVLQPPTDALASVPGPRTGDIIELISSTPIINATSAPPSRQEVFQDDSEESY